MKELLKNKAAACMAIGLMMCLLLAPAKPSEQSFLFPELTVFPSLEMSGENKEQKLQPRLFVFDFLRELFCTDND